jgi:hypothetical protein
MTSEPWNEDTRRALAQSLQAITEIDPDSYRGLREAAISSARQWEIICQGIQDSLSKVYTNVAASQNALNSVFSAFGSVFSKFAEQDKQARLLEGSGWLPHPTTPFDLIDVDMDIAAIDAVISAHYVKNWQTVEADFSTRVQEYDLDDEAKATFREALHAHRRGLHRVAPRLLFPEIERVGADEFHDGNHLITNENGKRSGIASLKDIRAEFDELPAGVTMNFPYGLGLYKRLQRHLYEKMDTRELISRAVSDPVPNRHASLHGIVCYNSHQTSLNAIIMTDFIFHLMDQLKFYVNRNESGAA